MAAAAVGIPVIIAAILLGGPAYTIVVALVLTFAALEFFAATDPAAGDHRGLLNQRPLAFIAAGGVALLVVAADNGFEWWMRALALLVVLPFVPIILASRAERGLADYLWALGGIMYVGFLGSHLVLLRDAPNGRDWVLLAIFATFATDTAAYIVGRLFGRTRIAPAISPGKTLEGSLGGIAGGVAAVLALNWALDAGAGAEIIGLALLLPVAAEIGDLAESMIKRSAGVKDASHVIPGHGGFLDRLDSILFTVPLVYYFLTWLVL
ncbi:MAG: phosphatidate cytidylyltransferase [Dehalococcoidia bacterium]